MKKIITLLFIVISNSIFAQNCNIGNESATGFGNSGDPIYRNYLLGVKYNLSATGVLTSLNLVGRNTGASVQMAVYEDVSGVPGNLVIASGTAVVGSGVVSLPVTPTQLSPGNYWIMAVYSADGGHTYTKVNSSSSIYYTSLTFGSAIPTNASGFTNYTGFEFTYFMGINCGTLGVQHIDVLPDFSLYPTPSKDVVSVNGDGKLTGSAYVITDLMGKPLLTGVVNEGSSIDISQLNTGVYLFQVGDQKKRVMRLIKE